MYFFQIDKFSDFSLNSRFFLIVATLNIVVITFTLFQNNKLYNFTINYCDISLCNIILNQFIYKTIQKNLHE